MKLVKVAPVRNKNPLFSPITVDVAAGSIVSIMGPSGIGKSSLLESISGVLPFTGQLQTGGKIFRVFQETDQLFPWMSVLDNLKLINKTVDWKTHAKTWQLEHLLLGSPAECSVGQRQRFTLMRAIYSDRPNLLCDEPLSGVDQKNGKDIIDIFKKEVKRNQKHVIWVTHNPNEAKQLGHVIHIQ